MAQYLTYEYLHEHRNDLADANALNEVRNIMYRQVIKVFLSHAHAEDPTVIDLVKGFFYEQGAVYIDWNDSNMLDTASPENIRRFIKTIRDSQKFIVVATPDSLKSNWIPWETGLADMAKGSSNIALLPIVRQYNEWKMQDFYCFYNKIESVSDQWQIVPSDNKPPVPIKDWIRSK